MLGGRYAGKAPEFDTRRGTMKRSACGFAFLSVLGPRHSGSRTKRQGPKNFSCKPGKISVPRSKEGSSQPGNHTAGWWSRSMPEKFSRPAGSTIKDIFAIVRLRCASVRRLLKATFPRPRRRSDVRSLVSDGNDGADHSDSAVGLGRVANSRYLPKAQRPWSPAKAQGRNGPVREPNKLQRLGEAVVTSFLPSGIHRSGTVF